MQIPPPLVRDNRHGLAGNLKVFFRPWTPEVWRATDGEHAVDTQECFAPDAPAYDQGAAGVMRPQRGSDIARHQENESRPKQYRGIEHIPHLRRYARALVRDPHAADDLVQDTLERAFNKRHLWRPVSETRARLFAIMHDVFVTNSMKHRSEAALNSEPLPNAEVMPLQGDGIEHAQMEKALHAIPAEEREVLLLVVLEQMTYEEVAKTLSIPIGTVLSQLSHARDRLHELMRDAS